MRYIISQTLAEVFKKDFIFSIFIGLCLLSFYHRLADTVTSDDDGWYSYAFIPLLNGFLCAVTMLILNHFFAGKKYTSLYFTRDKFKLLVIALIGGACSYYLSLSIWATYAITVVVMITAYFKIKTFISQLSQLLYPRRLATTSDAGRFFNFFITLIISFAVINLSVNNLHTSLGLGQAFNFDSGITGIIDALYFSIITMTTVGYGDIIPLSPLARIIVALECVTCYLTLGIMIGIICRGISFQKHQKYKKPL